jgi:hypothetical protein
LSEIDCMFGGRLMPIPVETTPGSAALRSSNCS